MGFFDSIKSFVSDPVGSIKDSGIGDMFGDNPLGGMLSSFMGGGSLGELGSLFGGLGDFSKILSVFMSLVETFNPDEGGFLSKEGLGLVKAATSQAKDSADLAQLAQTVGDVRERNKKADLKQAGGATEVATHNLTQLFAKAQAQLEATRA